MDQANREPVEQSLPERTAHRDALIPHDGRNVFHSPFGRLQRSRFRFRSREAPVAQPVRTSPAHYQSDFHRLFKSLFLRRIPDTRISRSAFPRVLENPKARESAAPDTDRPRNGQAGTGETEAGNRSSQYENGFFFRHNGKSKPKNVKRVRNERNHRSKNAR